MSNVVLPPDSGRAKNFEDAPLIHVKQLRKNGSMTAPDKIGVEILPPSAARAQKWKESPNPFIIKLSYPDGSVYEADLMDLIGGGGGSGGTGLPGLPGETPEFRMDPSRPNVLQYKFPSDADWTDIYTFTGEGGATDYNQLINRPQINSVVLEGDRALPEQALTNLEIDAMLAQQII